MNETQANMKGRDKELAELQEMYQSMLKQNKPQVALLMGEAGFGKWTVAVSFASKTSGASAHVITSSNLTQPIPYNAWHEFFQSCNLSQETVKQVLETKLEDPNLIPLLNDIGFAFKHNKVTKNLEGSERSFELKGVMVSWIEAVAQQKPLLIVMKDGQFLDNESVES